jgi:hypothetical protein
VRCEQEKSRSGGKTDQIPCPWSEREFRKAPFQDQLPSKGGELGERVCEEREHRKEMERRMGMG